MLTLWPRKKESELSEATSNAMTWDEQATQGLEQALAQAPVPTLVKGQIRKELTRAAEEAARSAGRTVVTASDLMQGLLAKLPANMRGKVEDAIKGGPDKLKDLEQDLKDQM